VSLCYCFSSIIGNSNAPVPLLIPRQSLPFLKRLHLVSDLREATLQVPSFASSFAQILGVALLEVHCRSISETLPDNSPPVLQSWVWLCAELMTRASWQRLMTVERHRWCAITGNHSSSWIRNAICCRNPICFEQWNLSLKIRIVKRSILQC